MRDLVRWPNRKRSKVLVMTCVFAAVVSSTLLVGGMIGLGEATETAPGEPASFFGTAVDEDGTAIPTGTRIVATVNGELVDSITVEHTGEYGGKGTFDDKLRVDSLAGDEVTFRFADAGGPIATSIDLTPGVFEENLTFPAGAVEYIHPEGSTSIEPATIAPGENVTLSGSDSTAFDDTELSSYHWKIKKDGDVLRSFDEANVSESFEENGTYDVELTVTDTSGRTDSTSSSFEVDPNLDTESSNDATDVSSDSGGAGTSGEPIASTSSSTGTGGTVGSNDGSSGVSSSVESTDDAESGSNDTFKIDSEPIVEELRDINETSTETSERTVTFDEPTVRELVFDNESANGNVSIREFPTVTDNTPPLPGEFQTVSASIITVPFALRDEPAIIRAVVDWGWLTAHDLEPHQLTVYRLPDSGSDWQSLPTEAYEIEAGVLVEAETPGFSQFVIAGPIPPEQPAKKMAPETGTNGTSEVGSDDSDGRKSGTGSDGSADATSETDVISFGPSSIGRPTASLLGLLGIAGLIGWIFIPRRRG